MRAGKHMQSATSRTRGIRSINWATKCGLQPGTILCVCVFVCINKCINYLIIIFFSSLESILSDHGDLRQTLKNKLSFTSYTRLLFQKYLFISNSVTIYKPNHMYIDIFNHTQSITHTRIHFYLCLLPLQVVCCTCTYVCKC